MQKQELSISRNYDDQTNEFLDNVFQYQLCPHCERNFFMGKLKYHLKLCKPDSPMIKSPKKKQKRVSLLSVIQKHKIQNELQTPVAQSLKNINQSNSITLKKCQFCQVAYTNLTILKHQQKCNFRPINQQSSLYDPSNNSFSDISEIKSRTKMDFKKQKPSLLPRLRNSANQSNKKYFSSDLRQLGEYTVRIRQQLSCFKKASEVQKISCPFCFRKFSRQASLRHIPICEKLKADEKNSLNLRKHSKSEVYKVSLVKKDHFSRSKPASSLSKVQQRIEFKEIIQLKMEIKSDDVIKNNPKEENRKFEIKVPEVQGFQGMKEKHEERIGQGQILNNMQDDKIEAKQQYQEIDNPETIQ